MLNFDHIIPKDDFFWLLFVTALQLRAIFLMITTVKQLDKSIGGHKSVNPLITKLTFSLTR